MMEERLLVALLAILSLTLTGCSTASPIQPVKMSKSGFEGAVYDGETIIFGSSMSGAEEFRIFHQAATGFVPLQAVRSSAEQRATEFCSLKGKTMNALRETAAKPPYILGNFPRIEIVFECVDKPSGLAEAAIDDPRYAKLASIKRLLDSGAITQLEFDSEKAKILSQP